MKKTNKFLLIVSAMLTLCTLISAQAKASGKLNSWTFDKVSSREKYEEILPIAYKMRISKNDGFDRMVFEFTESEIPEYQVRYTKSPITIDPMHFENPDRPSKNEFIKIKGNAFVFVTFAMQFEGMDVSKQFSGKQNLPIIEDVETVDWFENFSTLAVGLKSNTPFRIQELSNPTRLVIDFKSSTK